MNQNLKNMPPSLAHTLRNKFGLAIFAVSLASILAFGSYSVFESVRMAKLDAKRVNTALSQAFRSDLIAGDIWRAGAKMQGVLQKSGAGTLAISDASGKQIYPVASIEQQNSASWSCTRNPCWQGFTKPVLHRYPLYFDEGQKQLWGHVVLSTSHKMPWGSIGLVVMVVMLFMASIGAFTYATIKKDIDQTSSQLQSWAHYLTNSPEKQFKPTVTPYSELTGLSKSISNLFARVNTLTENARTASELTVLREIAHDLRTPLSQAAKYAEIIHMQSAQSAPIAAKHIDRLRLAIERTGNVVRQITSLQSAVGQESKSVDVSEYTSQLVISDHYRDLALQKRLVIKFEDKLANPFRVSEAVLFRVVDNLVRNGIDASPDGKILLIGLSELNGSPSLYVRDQGTGVSDEIRDKIFDINFSTKASRGSGLGLNIVKRLCAEIGAKLSFTNRPEGGAEFFVLFSGALEAKT